MANLDVESVRADFPILSMEINGNRLIYLDSAATSQKPKQVIDGIKYFYENLNANPLRSIHTLAEKAAAAYNDSREKIAKFINAERDEIVFTRNATEAINLVSFALPFRKGDRILTTLMEHHSNLLPWMRLRESGVTVDLAGVNDNNELDMKHFDDIPKDTKLVTVTHASNVTGTINDVESIIKKSHDAGALVMVDAAQSVPHMKIDVKKMDVDFLAFSGHKMLGPMGIGVLYVKKDVAGKLRPFLTGGEMIKEVKLDSVVYSDFPTVFEAGTQNIEGAYGLSLAVDYLDKIGMKNVEEYERLLTSHLYKRSKELHNVDVYSGKSRNFNGIFSFNVRGLHSHDTAYLLDKKGIAVRSGFHCAQPLIEEKINASGAARASLYIYNTFEEVDRFIDELNSIAVKYGR